MPSEKSQFNCWLPALVITGLLVWSLGRILCSGLSSEGWTRSYPGKMTGWSTRLAFSCGHICSPRGPSSLQKHGTCWPGICSFLAGVKEAAFISGEGKPWERAVLVPVSVGWDHACPGGESKPAAGAAVAGSCTVLGHFLLTFSSVPAGSKIGLGDENITLSLLNK